MRGIRITFEVIEDDGSVGLTREYVSDSSLMYASEMGSALAVDAVSGAVKFWQTIVGTEDRS